MQRVSIATSHYGCLLGNSNLHCDPDREPGTPCSLDNECNCKSKTIHDSLLNLRTSVGGIRCNASFDGVCGGYGAYMNNLESYDGLDFGRDYCLSGEFPLRRPENPAMVDVLSIRRNSVPKRYWLLAMRGWSAYGINKPTITVHDIWFIRACLDTPHCWSFSRRCCRPGRHNCIYHMVYTTKQQVK